MNGRYLANGEIYAAKYTSAYIAGSLVSAGDRIVRASAAKEGGKNPVSMFLFGRLPSCGHKFRGAITCQCSSLPSREGLAGLAVCSFVPVSMCAR